MTRLRLFVPRRRPEASSPCPWVLFGAEGEVLRQGCDELSALPLAHQIEVVVAADRVGFGKAALPPGNRRRLGESLPFLVEENLMAPAEQTHVVIAAMAAPAVAVLMQVDRAYLGGLLSALAAGGIKPARVLPATLLPDLAPGEWAVVCQGGEYFVRSGECAGLALEAADADRPPLALRLALDQARARGEAPASLGIYSGADIDPAAWERALDLPCRRLEGDWRLGRGYAGPDLLQGDFAPSTETWPGLARLRPAARLLLASLLVHTGGMGIDWFLKERELKNLDGQMRSLFLAAFPESGTVVDAPLQMARKLADLQHAVGDAGAGDFLPMLATATGRLGPLPEQSLKSMRYEPGRLILQMQAASPEAVQAIVQRASSRGEGASAENIKATAGGVEFQLVLKGGGA